MSFSMLHLITLLATISLIPLSPFALTSPANPAVVSFRGVLDLGIYYCTGPNWTGGCAWISTNNPGGNVDNFCMNIYNSILLGDTTHFSFGPDKGLVCNLFETTTCKREGAVVGGIRWPGWADIGSQSAVEDAMGGKDTSRVFRS